MKDNDLFYSLCALSLFVVICLGGSILVVVKRYIVGIFIASVEESMGGC